MLQIIYQNNEHDGWQEDFEDCKEPCPPLEELGSVECFFLKKKDGFIILETLQKYF